MLKNSKKAIIHDFTFLPSQSQWGGGPTTCKCEVLGELGIWMVSLRHLWIGLAHPKHRLDEVSCMFDTYIKGFESGN